jgi:cytochrome P450
MGQRPVVEFDHHSKDFLANRLAEWEKLRETPVAFSPRHGGFWVVSGHAEVAQVSRDEATFTGEFTERDGVKYRGIAGVPRARGIPPAGIAEAEGSIHQALRRVLNPFLLPNAVNDLRPLMQELTDWFIDQRVDTGRIDLVLDLTNPVPAVLTMKLIGLPATSWEDYAELFHATVAHRPGAAEYDRAISRVPEMMTELLAHASERRRSPRADLLSRLVELRLPDGRPLADAEIGSVLWNLVGGGLDTTTSLTSLTLHHLDTHPELRRQLIAQPELVGPATEEFLRYYSVNETLTRTVTKDTELGGCQLSRGEVVLISWLSANHDESEFERPGEVILDRAPNRHLAFGIGAHRCIGMHLARTMYQVLLGTILRRLPDYRVDREATRFYEGNPMLAGVVSMPATFTPGPRQGPAARPF